MNGSRKGEEGKEIGCWCVCELFATPRHVIRARGQRGAALGRPSNDIKLPRYLGT